MQSLLTQIIKRIMKALTHNGALIEEEGMSYLAEMETDAALAPLQSAACAYRHIAETGAVLTEAQVQTLEKKQDDDAVHDKIDTAHSGYLGSQDTFYVATIKGVGRVYQQTFVDTYSKWTAAKLYTTKAPITAADLLNDRVLPFFAEQGYGYHPHPNRSRY